MTTVAGPTMPDAVTLAKMLGEGWEVKGLRPAAARPDQVSRPAARPAAARRPVDVAAVDAAITALGDAVAAEWHERDYDERVFPEIAQRALTTAAVHDTLHLEALTAWLMGSSRVPRQVSSPDFGQPPITLYVGHKFYIEALVWREGTTSVHQHIFNGAFTVVQGSSLHSQFTFDEHDRVCDQLLLGRVGWQSSQLMLPGDIHRIQLGTAYIHSLFHLDHPSVTVVVRSYNTASGIQYEYFAPHVAADPFHHPQPLKVRLRALEALVAVDPDAFERTVEPLVAKADLWTVWRVLRATAEQSWGTANAGERVAYLATLARQRHSAERIDALVAAAAGRVRQLQIVRLRQTVRDPGHRFFLALLLNVPDAEAILDLIAGQCPGVDPADQAVAWLGEIAATGVLNLTLTPLALAMLRMAIAKASFADVLATLDRIAPAGQVDAHQGQLRQVWDDLHRLPLLATLTSGGQR